MTVAPDRGGHDITVWRNYGRGEVGFRSERSDRTVMLEPDEARDGADAIEEAVGGGDIDVGQDEAEKILHMASTVREYADDVEAAP